ncbi:cyclase family protein [Nonomuraea sp. NPDC005692]|uniref:cyclase family protein n=1 Tax=Nonomuraea sp. NPDC005692 TaxID=3157168 RepID=UPI0033E9048C
MTDHRASFDARITFGNGGDLAVHGFRVDLPGPDATEDEIAALFVASLGLLMTDGVELDNVEIFAEPHKGTRGGPSDRAAQAAPAAGGALVELARPPADGGTYLVAPGGDLTGLPLARTAELPAVVVRVAGAEAREVGVGALAAFDVRGRAVLLHTGARDGRSLTPEAAAWLAGQGASLVGTDADAVGGSAALAVLLAGGVPVVERLAGLDRLPPTGALFTAAPPFLEGVGRVPVRAFARVPEA